MAVDGPQEAAGTSPADNTAADNIAADSANTVADNTAAVGPETVVAAAIPPTEAKAESGASPRKTTRHPHRRLPLPSR